MIDCNEPQMGNQQNSTIKFQTVTKTDDTRKTNRTKKNNKIKQNSGKYIKNSTHMWYYGATFLNYIKRKGNANDVNIMWEWKHKQICEISVACQWPVRLALVDFDHPLP